MHYDRPVPESESGGGKRHLNPEFATLFGPPPSKLEVTALARPVDDLPSPVVIGANVWGGSIPVKSGGRSKDVEMEALAPFLQNRLLENWKIRNTIEALVGDNAKLPAQTDDRPFGIRFEDGRPIQFEFAGNELGVTIFGKEFRQGDTSYADPLNINIRFRLINDNGELKLMRAANAVTEFTYDPLPGKSLDVGFKSFLQDNLDKAMGNDPMENAISLPVNLIPLDRIEDADLRNQIANAQLTELSMENGWLTLGWSYVEEGQTAPKTYTPAIWNETPAADAAASVPEVTGELQ